MFTALLSPSWPVKCFQKWATDRGRTVLHKFGSLKSVTTTERLRSRARFAAYLGRTVEFSLYLNLDAECPLFPTQPRFRAAILDLS